MNNTTRVRVLNDVDFEQAGAPAMRHIFAGSDPLDAPFATWVTDKLLLHPVQSLLVSPLLDALEKSAVETGDRGFFVSLLTDPGDSKPWHWYVPVGDIASYSKLFEGPAANVIFSPSFKWGLIVSAQDFAILGGVPGFMEYLRKFFPGVDKQVDDFVKRRKREAQEGGEINWTAAVLQHVLGEERAASYIRKLGLG